MTRTDWNLGITVEGLGDADASHADKQYRFARLYQDAATGGGDLYIPVLTDFPSSFAAEVDFRGARSSLGGFAVEMMAQGSGADGVHTAARLYRSRYRPIAYLGAAMTAAASTITLVDAAGAAITSGLTLPLGIALERECLVLLAHTSGGVYSCTRGQFGTIAAAHSIGEGDDVAVFESEHWHIPADRQVVLFRTQRNRDQTNEEVITRGVVRDVSSPTPDRIRLDCAGPLELLQLRQLCSKLWRGSIELTAGNVGRVRGYDATWTAVGYSNLTARQDDPSSGLHYTLLMVDGNHAAINLWDEVSLRISPNVHIFTTEEIYTRQFVGSPRIESIADIDGKQAWEFFSLHPTAPDLSPGGLRLGKATVNGTTLSANLFVALLQCLLTTPDGGNHDTYDMGDTSNPRLYDNLGFGVPASLVNITGIEDLALELADIARMPLLHFGVDGEGFDGLEFFQEALKVLGCVLTSGDEGKLSVVRFRDVALLGAPSIPQADVVGIPQQRKRVEDTFDSLVVEYAEIPGIGTVRDTFDDVINHRRLLSGRHRQATLDARGIEDRDLFRGPIIARHVQRYHYPIPEIKLTCLRSQNHWPGTIVKCTHDKIYAGSTRGVTDATLLITGRNESIKDGTITYRALDVGVAYGRAGLIAPSARVTAWDSGTKTVTIGDPAVYTAVVGAGDDITTDCSATVWPAGAEVMFRTAAMNARDVGPFTVVSATATTVVIDSSPTGLVATDIMVPALYDSADDVQAGKWIWLAGTDDKLGAGSDDPYEWTL